MSVRMGQTTKYDIYREDRAMIGRILDFEEPPLEFMEVEQNTLGQEVELSLPGRTLKKLGGKVKFAFLDTDLCPDIYIPNRFMKWRLVPFVDVFGPEGVIDDDSYRVNIDITIAVRRVGGGALKNGEKFEGEFDYSVTRYVKGRPGEIPWREIDVINQVNRVNGVDVWGRY